MTTHPPASQILGVLTGLRKVGRAHEVSLRADEKDADTAAWYLCPIHRTLCVWVMCGRGF